MYKSYSNKPIPPFNTFQMFLKCNQNSIFLEAQQLIESMSVRLPPLRSVGKIISNGYNNWCKYLTTIIQLERKGTLDSKLYILQCFINSFYWLKKIVISCNLDWLQQSSSVRIYQMGDLKNFRGFILRFLWYEGANSLLPTFDAYLDMLKLATFNV